MHHHRSSLTRRTTHLRERLTFAAVLPHAQVDVRDLVAAAVAVGQLGHLEHVLLDAGDVVAVVAQHPRQRCLLQLGQLSRAEHARVLIPEPGQRWAGKQRMSEERFGFQQEM